jgi:hypothetical protein
MMDLLSFRDVMEEIQSGAQGIFQVSAFVYPLLRIAFNVKDIGVLTIE